MTEYDRKFAAALAELQATDMWDTNYNPPLLRVQRRLGWSARPPHYAPFWRIWSGYALWFGLVWGVAMWFIIWRGQGFSPASAAGAAALAGIIFGGLMAGYFARARHRYKLSRWEEL
ncbi:hypothetical protein HKX54_17585 [Sulfitobacter sp. M57]|uniref:DUF6404 family protein n=1 Tax=unclassified Sulfitobacter TaxID=196795 RepID=UPI0023E0D9F1|nr:MULTISPECIES: DUF6404 family protein [unclassified Sulfitobacter]MDF3416286.1 hypothetical protein [Sulfitobacter sp. KE5]MDF3423765.1 hypothetical protein [Sulfitobacter sp. KE43]MDF3434832.1 hypothetical protein [Sulfitobacter sp. KE42]MDF3460471.1 hypothetical protein [Sulfitobacter sp. S74]MDF3464369.1 hypothetical protein [Sulfitobacter sp. Ks18]